MSRSTTVAGAHAGTLYRSLSVVCLLLTLVAGTARSTVARAAPNPLLTMLDALVNASAYQVTYTAHSTETPPAVERRTLVLVRKNGDFKIHALDAMRPSGAGDTTIVEDVASSATVCERVAFGMPRGRYACNVRSTGIGSLNVLAEPVLGLVGERAVVSFAGTSARSIGGQRCAGYTFSASAGKAHSKGTIYMGATGLPCEQDATTFGPAIGPSNGQAMATIKSVTVWSHANDPHLAMPAGVLPASAGNGTFAVQPAAARVGQLVRLSGRYTGREDEPTPFVQIASFKLRAVSRSTLAQCGGTAPEPVAFGVVKVGSGSHQGKAWQVSVRVPAHLTTYVGGNEIQIPTPPGVYRLVADFGPAYFCPSDLPAAQGKGGLVATLTVLP